MGAAVIVPVELLAMHAINAFIYIDVPFRMD
jgi:hypothetical protein